MQVNNYFNNNIFYPSLELPEDRWLEHLIEKGDEKAVLNFVKTCTLILSKWRSTGKDQSQKSLVTICIERGWDTLLQHLSERGEDYLLDIVHVISRKDHDILAKLLKVFKGGQLNCSIKRVPNETVLWHALNEKNYQAAAILIQHGASLEKSLPDSLRNEVKAKFKADFFNNPYYHGVDGEKYFEKTFSEDFQDSLFAAIAYHYYPQDPEALNFMLEYPQFITTGVLKTFIRLNDTAAFNKALIPYLKLVDILYNKESVVFKYLQLANVKEEQMIENRNADLLNYALRDFHFSLMGFEVEYLLPRLGIIHTLLALNPSAKTLDKYVMTTHEIVHYLQLCLPKERVVEFQPIFTKLLEDPTGFYDAWRLQRLLINNLGIKLPYPKNSRGIEVAAYPSVANYFQHSVTGFLQDKGISDDWIFVTPQKKFTVDNCLQWINEKKILKFFTGWTGGDDEGHGINVVVYDNLLWVCNRGGGSVKDKTCGLCLYEIQDKSLLKELVQLFLERSQKTEAFIAQDLIPHPKIKAVKALLLSSQKVGNCVYLSEKMGVYACFIASFIKQGQTLEEALTSGKALYKQWSRQDRIDLFKEYLHHPYHKRKSADNESEGILLKQILPFTWNKVPKSLRSKYLDMIMSRLEDPEFIEALCVDDEHELMIKPKYERFICALDAENTALALSMIDKFQDINSRTVRKETLLHLACRYGNLEVAKELIRRGANTINKSVNNRCPLQELFIRYNEYDRFHRDVERHRALVKLMLEATPLSELAQTDCFPLHSAIHQGHEFGVQEILKKGFDLLLPNSNGENVYHYAAISKSERLSRELLSQCPDIEIKTKRGFTPLHMAITYNNLPAAKILLERGANPNALSEDKLTPITEVKNNQEIEICQLLIEKGADVNAPTFLPGVSLLMIHITEGNTGIVNVILQADSLDLYKEEANKGETSLNLAIKKGWINVVSKLLEKGMNPNYKNILGLSPLHIAASGQQVEICKLLLEEGAHKNAKNLKGQIPYDLAKEWQNQELMDLLFVPVEENSADLPIIIEDTQ